MAWKVSEQLVAGWNQVVPPTELDPRFLSKPGSGAERGRRCVNKYLLGTVLGGLAWQVRHRQTDIQP